MKCPRALKFVKKATKKSKIYYREEHSSSSLFLFVLLFFLFTPSLRGRGRDVEEEGERDLLPK
jgi:hypothetical protein